MLLPNSPGISFAGIDRGRNPESRRLRDAAGVPRQPRPSAVGDGHGAFARGALSRRAPRFSDTSTSVSRRPRASYGHAFERLSVSGTLARYPPPGAAPLDPASATSLERLPRSREGPAPGPFQCDAVAHPRPAPRPNSPRHRRQGHRPEVIGWRKTSAQKTCDRGRSPLQRLPSRQCRCRTGIQPSGPPRSPG